MRITIIGVGCVGLVTERCLIDLGDSALCPDVNQGNTLILQSPEPWEAMIFDARNRHVCATVAEIGSKCCKVGGAIR